MKLLALTVLISICLTGVSVAGESPRKDRDRSEAREYGQDRYAPKTNAEKRDDGEKWHCGNVPTPGCERPSGQRRKPVHCGNIPTPGCED